MGAGELFVDETLPDAAPGGFRFDRLEVLNWGTFDKHVWQMKIDGKSALLTGDYGSGKSTLVDALATLLVPPRRLAYNRAGGAESKERTPRSYVLGYWKSERTDVGTMGRAVPLRGINTYSVILGVFRNPDLEEAVTLAQVLWFDKEEGEPRRLYVVSGRELAIGEHFSGFGSDITPLKKRLQAIGCEMSTDYPSYGRSFRRRFGLDAENDQALDLFNQTISMKTVGNLTSFVREHMLEPFPVSERMTAMLQHFENLERAHEAVLKAKRQVAALRPLVDDCDKHASCVAEGTRLEAARAALPAWFAGIKRELGLARKVIQEADLAKALARLDGLAEKRRGLEDQRDGIQKAIAANGGERLESIRRDTERLGREREERQGRAAQYEQIAKSLGLKRGEDSEEFVANRQAIAGELALADGGLADTENDLHDRQFDLRRLRDEHHALSVEVEGLRKRRTNIPGQMVELRARLCAALGLEEQDLPFAGELLRVRESEREWEGAVERVLRNFGTSLLVADAHYRAVAEWVNRANLGRLLGYYWVRSDRPTATQDAGPDALLRKVEVKPDSDHYQWLGVHIARRFDYVCCEDLDQFRRERLAVTKAGQIKGSGDYHQKDDRYAIDDRSRYVLGWANEAKVAALTKRCREIEEQIRVAGAAVAEAQARAAGLRSRAEGLRALALFDHFRTIDWKATATEIDALERERRAIAGASAVLPGYEAQLAEVKARLAETVEAEREDLGKRGKLEERLASTTAMLADCDAEFARLPADQREVLFPLIEEMREAALGDRAVTIEGADKRTTEFREHIQALLSALTKREKGLAARIGAAMEAFRAANPIEAKDFDSSLEAQAEYRLMLKRLVDDDLPAFEQRFKRELTEGSINSVAVFHAKLKGWSAEIQERIEEINRPLRDVDYNTGRYIELTVTKAPDSDVVDFQRDLRTCAEGGLSGTEDESYSETKFLQVKAIIDRFRNRDGVAEEDARWTKKVTDVRNWWVFSASERRRSDGGEHEFYPDSSGKSGGQKEKLAYTVLASSLAYQFGLKRGEKRDRSFRFVIVDEAFSKGSDKAAEYALSLFRSLGLQLLVVTPLQKVHVIESHISTVAFVHSRDGRDSQVQNLTIDEFRAKRAAWRPS